MDYHFKIWLEKEGQPVLGDGLCTLLREIQDQGSIRRAAESLRMSYRQAWGSINKAENRLGTRLLDKKIGGESGGGAQLTSDAVELLAKYSRFKEEVDTLVDKVFNSYFRQ